MTAYLSSLKTAPQMTGGEQTYKTLCMRCHGEKGDGHGKIAIYLDPYPRDLTKAAVRQFANRPSGCSIRFARASRGPRCPPGARS